MTRSVARDAPAHDARGADGRIVIVVAVAVYGAGVAVAELAWGVDLWRVLGVKSAPSLFFDARNVAAAADCWAQGHDPLVSNPCDPWHRVMCLTPACGSSCTTSVSRRVGPWRLGRSCVATFLVSLLLVVGRLSLREGSSSPPRLCPRR